VDGLKTVREKRILKPCLMQESHSAKVLQSYFSLPCVAGGEAWVASSAFNLNSFTLTA